MQVFLLLLPEFALILLGAGLRHRAGFSADFWAGLEKLVYFVLFPALLFNALAKAHIDLATTMPLFGMGLITVITGLLFAYAARPLMGLGPISFASRLQCAFRFNTYIAIAVAGKLHGPPGIALMGALCGAMVPFVNVAAVSALARHSEHHLLRELMRNPLILATLAGLVFNLSGTALPQLLQHFLGRLADASVALGLLTVGAALRLGKTEGHWGGLAWIAAVKLVALPAVVLLLGKHVGLSGLAFDIAVLFAALPTASSAYILAVRMGGDGAGVAWLISVTTLLSMFTMTAWIVAIGG